MNWEARALAAEEALERLTAERDQLRNRNEAVNYEALSERRRAEAAEARVAELTEALRGMIEWAEASDSDWWGERDFERFNVDVAAARALLVPEKKDEG